MWKNRPEEVGGRDIGAATTAKPDEEARALLKHFRFPFRQ